MLGSGSRLGSFAVTSRPIYATTSEHVDSEALVSISSQLADDSEASELISSQPTANIDSEASLSTSLEPTATSAPASTNAGSSNTLLTI